MSEYCDLSPHRDLLDKNQFTDLSIVLKPQFIDRIDSKVTKWLNQHHARIIMYKQSISDVLAAFATLRQDIGFVSGMEKIACQLAVVMHENYYLQQDDLQLNEETFEADLFSLLTNLFQSSDKHFGHFLLSDFDEISWRLDYFDKLLEKELPQLSLHFKAIGLQS